MLTLVVGLSLASIADLEVDQLDLTEARAEDIRLSTPPSRVPYATMLGVGLLALPTGVGSLFFVLDHWARFPNTGLLRVFNDFVYGCFAVATGVIGFAGLALSIAGGVLLSVTARRADDMLVRQALVRDRIRMLEGRDRVDPQRLDTLEQELLREQRPAMGLPAGLLGGGIGALVVGGFSAAAGVETRYWASVIAGGGEMAIGLGMIAVAIWQFVARSEERERIDARLEELQSSGSDVIPPTPPPLPPALPPPPPPPPGASLLPPAPVLVSWGFQF